MNNKQTTEMRRLLRAAMKELRYWLECEEGLHQTGDTDRGNRLVERIQQQLKRRPSTKRPLTGWAQSDALRFCKELTDHLKPCGYAVALTGSVLTKGESTKDLDIVVFPLSTAKQDPEGLQSELRRFGMHCALGAKDVRLFWRKAGSKDRKHVEVWQYNYKRVDIFFLK